MKVEGLSDEQTTTLERELEIADQASLKMLLVGVTFMKDHQGSTIAGFTMCGMTVARMCIYLDHMGMLSKETFMRDFHELVENCLKDCEASDMRGQLDKIKAMMDAK